MDISIGGLNIIDILILILVFVSVIIGFSRGLISEVLSLATLIAAFAIAIMFTNPLAAYFSGTSTMQGVVSQTSGAIGANTAQPISYLTIGFSFGLLFVVTLIIGTLAKMILNLMFQTGILGFGNRVLGGGFGFVRGILLTLVIIFLVQLSPMAAQSWWQQSTYVRDFQPGVVWLGSIVSPALENLKSTFGSTINNATGAVKSMIGQ
jgi:membrane protein required for colicin V production